MVDYLTLISNWMKQPHYLLIILITLYAISGTIDFLLGTFNAYRVNYNSRKAQLGIVRKLATLFLMVLVVPLALILPFEIGVYSLSVLYIGIVLSEIYSILAHIGLVQDGDKNNIVGNLFVELLETVFTSRNKKD